VEVEESCSICSSKLSKEMFEVFDDGEDLWDCGDICFNPS
jgi:hypothetical protein